MISRPKRRNSHENSGTVRDAVRFSSHRLAGVLTWVRPSIARDSWSDGLLSPAKAPIRLADRTAIRMVLALRLGFTQRDSNYQHEIFHMWNYRLFAGAEVVAKIGTTIGRPQHGGIACPAHAGKAGPAATDTEYRTPGEMG